MADVSEHLLVDLQTGGTGFVVEDLAEAFSLPLHRLDSLENSQSSTPAWKTVNTGLDGRSPPSPASPAPPGRPPSPPEEPQPPHPPGGLLLQAGGKTGRKTVNKEKSSRKRRTGRRTWTRSWEDVCSLDSLLKQLLKTGRAEGGKTGRAEGSKNRQNRGRKIKQAEQREEGMSLREVWGTAGLFPAWLNQPVQTHHQPALRP